MKRIIFLLCCFLYSLSAYSSAPSLSGFYIGELSPGHYVKLHLRQEGNMLYGHYGYDADHHVTYVPNTHRLQGVIEAANFVVLKQVYDGGELRLFEGFIDQKTHIIRGNWFAHGMKAIDLKRFQLFLHQGQLKVSHQSIQQIDPALRRKIIIYYPQLKSHHKQLAENENKFNAYISNRIFILQSQFERDVMQAELKGDGLYLGDSTLYIDYDLSYADFPFISIRFNVSAFYSGMNHPISSSLTVNYDLNKGQVLTLNTFFKKYSLFLQSLAEVSRTQLQATLPKIIEARELPIIQYWIQSGTEAQAHNFQSWNLTPMGFLISFDPYQVAPYAFGRHEIIIPYAFFAKEYNINYQNFLAYDH